MMTWALNAVYNWSKELQFKSENKWEGNIQRSIHQNSKKFLFWIAGVGVGVEADSRFFQSSFSSLAATTTWPQELLYYKWNKIVGSLSKRGCPFSTLPGRGQGDKYILFLFGFCSLHHFVCDSFKTRCFFKQPPFQCKYIARDLSGIRLRGMLDTNDDVLDLPAAQTRSSHITHKSPQH